MSAPLTRADLDAMGCAMPDCTHEDHDLLYVHATCHPSAGSRCVYDAQTGVLGIACRECGRPTVHVQVAP